jgi:hypothetical protein
MINIVGTGAMPMTIVPAETTVSNETISMRLADSADKEWIKFEVRLSNLRTDNGDPVSNPRSLLLGALQRAALSYVREALSYEIPSLPIALLIAGVQSQASRLPLPCDDIMMQAQELP